MEKFLLPVSPAEETVRQVAEPLIEQHNCELVKVRVALPAVTLFVETKEEGQHISLEQITTLSHLISPALDVTDANSKLFAGRYDLEVSSPGIDRPLAKLSHFQKAVGEEIKVTYKRAGDRAQTARGILKAVHETSVEIEVKGKGQPELVVIEFKLMQDAHVVYRFATKGK